MRKLSFLLNGVHTVLTNDQVRQFNNDVDGEGIPKGRVRVFHLKDGRTITGFVSDIEVENSKDEWMFPLQWKIIVNIEGQSETTILYYSDIESHEPPAFKANPLM